MKTTLRLALPAVLLLTACPPTGVVCKPGTVPCGNGCIDPTSDRRNCGGCGLACATGEDCVRPEGAEVSQCTCRGGTTECAGACVVTAYDARHCGACGNACADGQVCENGACRAACTAGQFARCGDSCIDVSSDVANCGACGATCEQGQQCRAGLCSYEAVAACYWSGQVVGFSPGTGVKGPLSDVGSNPGALAAVGSTLLAADGTDRRLYSAVPGAGGAWLQGSRAFTTGAVPNQVLVARPYVFVVNASTATLQVLEEGKSAGAVTVEGVEAPLTLGTVGEVNLGVNTFPQGAARVGDVLWVPLYGGFGAEAADAGQALVKVNVATPAQPALVGTVSLKGLDLKPFDGGTPVARPFAVTAHRGHVYVALNNLHPDTYAPEGPGLLAKVDPATDAVSVIDLGAGDCLNPQWVTSLGDALAVSCGGRVTYSPTFEVERVEASGVLLLDGADAKLATWTSGACASRDAGCLPMMPGRLAAQGTRLLVSDQNAGRVVVLETADGGLTEVRGVEACPVSATTGVANVSDVLVP
jgi:hypothetical protein